MKIDRNAPCPCGSGKKFKKCCYGKTSSATGAAALQDIMAEVRDRLESGEISSLEEAQALVNAFMNQKNSASLAEFHGLSPEQMHRLLRFPFESPALIRFAEAGIYAPTAPALTLFSLLAEAIGDKGLTPTAKGNLPQRFCREAALAFWGEEKYAKNTRFGSIRSEMDFFDMHCLRLVADLAGLVRKYKGKFILTAKCREQIAAHGVGAVYPDLFRAYAQKFNWGYRDRYQEIPFFQQAFLFTLFLLQKYGGESRPQSFYEDIFLQAFPDLFRDVKETSYQTVEETLRNAYFYRALENFAGFFGLAELVKISGKDFPERYEVKKLPLLDQFVFFTV